MEDQEADPHGITGKIKEYVRIRKELVILTAVEKGSQLFANLLTAILVVLFTVLTVLFGSLALGFYLSEIMGNTYSGFLIVAGFYLLIVLIVYLTKDKYLEKRIINNIIKKFFKDKNEADENKDS
jgi:hypothetical protein